MPSKSKLKRLAKKQNEDDEITPSASKDSLDNEEEDLKAKQEDDDTPDQFIEAGEGINDPHEDLQELRAQELTANGILTTHPLHPDIHIDKFSVSIYGMDLIEDSELILNRKQKYGLIGLNGSGKSTMMTAIGRRLVPIPPNTSIFFLENEVAASEDTALNTVVNILTQEREKIEEEIGELEMIDSKKDFHKDRLDYLYTRLDILEDGDDAIARAAKILHGLGFTKKMQDMHCKSFSGGWRMRIALAQALFIEPEILLLDEPTNHLDLNAVIFLEEYLKLFKGTLLLVSHSQDFLNEVCTSIIHLHNKKLKYYTGNFDTYIMTRESLEANQMKQYNWEQEEIKRMKDYINRFGNSSIKLARQAKSKEKTLNRVLEKGVTEKVVVERIQRFRFAECGSLPLPILQLQNVSFGYPGGKILFNNVEMGIDLDSRMAIVGKNGTGKSTLLKLMMKELQPTSGFVKVNAHLRIGYFHQHLHERLDGNLTPLQWLMNEYPDEYEHNSNGIEDFRRKIGPFGISGGIQTKPIKTLSDGEKVRVMFAWLAMKKPHLLILDEPTNHLSIEAIDALAEGLNNFGGGVVLVSHDFRLINQVAKEIWECKDHKFIKYKGDILDYKAELRKEVMEELGMEAEH